MEVDSASEDARPVAGGSGVRSRLKLDYEYVSNVGECAVMND